MIKFSKSLFETKRRLNDLTETSETCKTIEIEDVIEVIKPIVIMRNSKDLLRFFKNYKVSQQSNYKGKFT